MKTVTKKEDFTCIVYDEELKRKCDIVLSLHTILWILIPMYILLFRANDKIYNYLWIIFYVFFIISYRLEPYLSKIKIILYEDKIEIKKEKKQDYFCIQIYGFLFPCIFFYLELMIKFTIIYGLFFMCFLLFLID